MRPTSGGSLRTACGSLLVFWAAFAFVLSGRGTPLPEGERLLPSYLQERGYFTGHMAKTHYGPNAERQFQWYEPKTAEALSSTKLSTVQSVQLDDGSQVDVHLDADFNVIGDEADDHVIRVVAIAER